MSKPREDFGPAFEELLVGFDCAKQANSWWARRAKMAWSGDPG